MVFCSWEGLGEREGHFVFSLFGSGSCVGFVVAFAASLGEVGEFKNCLGSEGRRGESRISGENERGGRWGDIDGDRPDWIWESAWQCELWWLEGREIPWPSEALELNVKLAVVVEGIILLAGTNGAPSVAPSRKISIRNKKL